MASPADPDQLQLKWTDARWALEPAAPNSQNSELLYFYEWEVRNCAASTPSQLYDLSAGSRTGDVFIPKTTIWCTPTTIETPMSAVVRWLRFD